MAPRFNLSGEAGGMFDGLKSRLGFSDSGSSSSRSSRKSNSARNDDYDEYDDEFGDAEDYDEFAEYGPDYDDGSTRKYEPLSEVSTRPAGSRRNSSAYSSYGSFRNNNLVTIDDVKSSTRTQANAKRETVSARSTVPAGATPVGTPASAVSPAETAAIPSRSPRAKYVDDASAVQSGASRRSEGLDSLFDSTTPAADKKSDKAAYDPYEAYESSKPSTHTPARSISVLRPASYGDVERIAKILKSGDVVVIALRSTPDDLSKRILDFSFGVASALDAAVECPGDKVFAITRGNALSASEKQALKNQGVL